MPSPGRSSLINRGINCSPSCTICDSGAETIDHFFMECDWPRQVWFVSPLGVVFQNVNDTSSSFIACAEHVVQNNSDEVIRLVNMERVIKYILKRWIWRVLMLLRDGCSQKLTYLSARMMPNSKLICRLWQLQILLWGWYKLNIDAVGPNKDGS